MTEPHIKALDERSALAPGSSIWMIADLDRSAWARKIDWYLNFQLLRSEPHRAPEISSQLSNVIATWDFEAPRIEVSPRAPLMIASAALLPNRSTILVPIADSALSPDVNPAEWVKTCFSIWMNLGRPTLRVFLPANFTHAAFEKAWPAANRSAAIELVTETARV